MPRSASRAGQATVEIIALVPALLLLALLAWQVAAAAHAWQLAGSAARAGARAEAVGAPAQDAARAALPAGHGRGAHVQRARTPAGQTRLRVRLRVPSVLPGVRPSITVSAWGGPEP